MLQFDPARPGGASSARGAFVLYLEGPGDQGILEGWCRRMLPGLVRELSRSTVILGGRQPARAREHFRKLRRRDADARALCVLDRDDGSEPESEARPEPGLEFFTWGRRHIESYLLVPEAIERGLRLGGPRGRVRRVLKQHLPPEGDEAAYQALDAKRLLASRGALARSLGVPIPLARIARATRDHELHADVLRFFDRLRGVLGVPEPQVFR